VGISVAGLNVHGGRDRDGVPYSVTKAVAGLDADVVVVQENWRAAGEPLSVAARAAAECGYPGFAEIEVNAGHSLGELGLVPGDPEAGAWGLAVMSRIPWTGTASVGLGAAPGDVIGERRALVVEVPDEESGQVLRIVGVHFTHRLVHGPAQLRRLLAALRTKAAPTVIVGDLNMCRPTVALAWPYRPVVRGRSWPAHRPVAQIDHVLAGPGVRAREARVLPEVGSDHRPTRAVLTLAAANRPVPGDQAADERKVTVGQPA
jgi:endonuclease/exonuclease/phosphatase family metal-dependent hydrolase